MAFLILAVAAFTILVWRLIWPPMKRIEAGKLTLLCGALAFVLCGLFPRWLHFYGSRSVNKGYHFMLTHGEDDRLDMSRLGVEWLCVLVATGAAWMLVGKPKKDTNSQTSSP